jgi:antitoxin component of MazEF toxin-antitoxin module
MPTKITNLGGSPALLIPAEILAQMGLRIGDEIEITPADGVLTMRPLPDAERAAKVLAATDDVFARRADALRQLAHEQSL